MKRQSQILIPLVLFLLPIITSGIVLDVAAQQQPVHEVAVSVASLAGIVEEVGGALVTTTVMVEQEFEPHAFSLTPEIIAIADSADLLVFTGHFHWEEELANQTATPFITLHDADAWESYEDYGAELSPMPGDIEVEEEEHEEHEHEGNLHGFWLLPSNALAVANATRAALTTLNGTLAGDWTANFNAFADSVDELQNVIDTLDGTHGFSEKHAVVVFPAEAYVAEAFGITVEAVLQVENVLISGAGLYNVQEAIRNGSIDLIIGSDVAQFQTGGDYAYQLQADNGGILIWWRTLFFAESEYLWMMNYNLGALVSGLEGRSGAVSTDTLNIGLLGLSSVLGVLVVIETVLLVMRARAE